MALSKLPHRSACTWRRVGVMAALAGVLASAQAADAPAPKLVRDPHYGDTLFQFFQDHYFTAVTGLMVSQHFERVSRHADEAEVLRGGLLLSYGLHREAGEVFASLLEKGAAPPVRDRAWFYLAKIRYQRGLSAQALEALASIGTHLPPALDEERVLMHANLLMAGQDYAGAAKLLERLAPRPDAGLYARYNLGVALIRSGDISGGRGWLDDLGKSVSPQMPPTEEYRSLRDQANLALGFASLQQDQPDAAWGYLQRVRLDGMQANKALLGYGWSLTAAKKHREALVPWTELLGRGPPGRALLVRPAGCIRPGAGALQPGDRFLQPGRRSTGRIDRRDPRRQTHRRPAGREPRRRDGLVLRHRPVARHAACRPSVAGAGRA
jgi:tetratricopeptide (TPR) repeat protein